MINHLASQGFDVKMNITGRSGLFYRSSLYQCLTANKFSFLDINQLCTSSTSLCVVPVTEPKPVYAQPGQPDVDLPVSPSDAPVPNAAHDDSILR